jgi:hypothetical protein
MRTALGVLMDLRMAMGTRDRGLVVVILLSLVVEVALALPILIVVGPSRHRRTPQITNSLNGITSPALRLQVGSMPVHLPAMIRSVLFG